jgi:hypothetical protein
MNHKDVGCEVGLLQCSTHIAVFVLAVTIFEELLCWQTCIVASSVWSFILRN